MNTIRQPHRIIPVFLVLIASLAPVSAQDNAVSERLQNALQVVLVEDHSVPVVQVGVFFKGGASSQIPENSGLATVHQSLMLAGHEKFPSRREYLDQASRLGISVDGFTGEDFAALQFSFSGDSLAAGLEFVRMSLVEAKFDDAEIDRAKLEALARLRYRRSAPSARLEDAISTLQWGRFASRKNIYGEIATIRAITPDMLRLYHVNYIAPNNCIIVIAGDIDRDETLELSRKAFARWTEGFDPESTYPLPEFAPVSARIDTILTGPSSIARAVWSWNGPSIGRDPLGSAIGDILARLANLSTSKFQRSLVNSGLASDVSVAFNPRKNMGAFTISVTLEPKDMAAFRVALFRELNGWLDPEYFSMLQFAAIQHQISREEAAIKSDMARFIFRTGLWWAMTTEEFYSRYADARQGITQSDLINFVDRYLYGKPVVAAALVNRQSRTQYEINKGSLLP